MSYWNKGTIERGIILNTGVVAGIVLFNPDLERLAENIWSVINQVDKLVLVDNGSKNYYKIKKMCVRWSSDIQLIRNIENKGIAAALNQIMQFAYDNRFEWVLSLDQDSVCCENLIINYLKYTDCADIGMLTCHIEDRNFQFETDNYFKNNIEVTDFCITSGSLLRTATWLEVGKYDEIMFIDKVDTDMCWRLVEQGWKIVRVPYIGILHEIGNKTERIRFFNREVVIFNHSPFRCYYIVRNGIYCSAKHKQFRDTKGMKKSSYHRILLCILFEKNKIQKLIAGIKGLKDGYKLIKENNLE